jgi:hypothetical protein
MAGTHSTAIAVAAARLIVEEGMEYGAAKRRAARDLRVGGRSPELPDNDQVEDEVRTYLDLFRADTQPAELAELRRIAATWMERLFAFRPHLTGAVWRGTATRMSSICIDLFCDDSKSAELALIDMRVDYDVSSSPGPRGRVLDVLNLQLASRELGGRVHLALTIRDYDDLRGALQRDARGRSDRGDLAALRARGPS